MGVFKDHFSTASADYAAHRPTYPPELAAFLAALAPGRGLAVDCGCGTGQLAVRLAGHFDRVIAIDASATQIANAEPHPRVGYAVAPAERSGLAGASADLVTAAQAAHWFDLPAFYAETRRIGRPGAIVALVAYGIMQTDDVVGPVFSHFYRDVVGPYWPPERRHVEAGYRTLDFPFAEMAAPPMAIRVSWNLEDLLGYVGTWSAVRGAEAALGRAPAERFQRDLAAVWGDPRHRRIFAFPLSLRVGRIAAAA